MSVELGRGGSVKVEANDDIVEVRDETEIDDENETAGRVLLVPDEAVEVGLLLVAWGRTMREQRDVS